MRKTAKMRQIEEERGKPIKEVLNELFDQGLSPEEVGEQLGVDMSTVYNWLARLGGERRWVIPEPTAEEA